MTGAPADPADDRALVARSGLFDAGFYAAQDRTAGDDPLGAYVCAGGRAGLSPHPLFSALDYLRSNPDVASAGVDPLVHYLRHGWLEGRRPSPLFDADFVCRGHLAGTAREPLGAYFQEGAARGWRPHPFADPAADPPRPDEPPWGPLARRMAAHTPWPTPSARPARIAAVAHVFYPELWPELALSLDRLPRPFDLFVSLPPHAAALEPEILEAFPSARVRAVANAGRDILPFLSVLGELIDGGYDVACKVHTKGGASYPDTWRRLMLASLLGEEARVARILAAFACDPDLAVVGPGRLYVSGPRFSTETLTGVLALLERLYGPGVMPPGEWGFFAGSMFWFRPEAFRRLRRDDLRRQLEADGPDSDGQLSHVVERLFGLVPALDNRRIGRSEWPDPGAMESVDVDPAPAWPLAEPLGERLAALSRRLMPVTPELRRARARTWIATADVPWVVLAMPSCGSQALLEVANGYRAALDHARVSCRVMDDAEIGEAELQGAVVLTCVDVGCAVAVERVAQRDVGGPARGSRYAVALARCAQPSLDADAVRLLHAFDEIWTGGEAAADTVRCQVMRPVRVVRPALLTSEPYPKARLSAPVVAAIAPPDDDLRRLLLRESWLAYGEAFTIGEGARLHVAWSGVDDPGLFGRELRLFAAGRLDVEVGGPGSEAADIVIALESSGDVWPELVRAVAEGSRVVAMNWASARDLPGAVIHRVEHRLTVDAGGRVAALPHRSSLVAALRAAAAEMPPFEGGAPPSPFALNTASAAIRRELDRIRLSGGGRPSMG